MRGGKEVIFVSSEEVRRKEKEGGKERRVCKDEEKDKTEENQFRH